MVITNGTQTVVDKTPISPIVITTNDPNATVSVDSAALPNGVTYDPATKTIGGTPNVTDWSGNEETKTFVIPVTVNNPDGSTSTKNVEITVNRNTDGDGIPDITDNDDDNDGYSDEVEKAIGSDPKNPYSIPVTIPVTPPIIGYIPPMVVAPTPVVPAPSVPTPAVPTPVPDITDNDSTVDDDPNDKYVPKDLNSIDHIAYVRGYSDGTVKPNNNVTRAETATMLYRLLTDTRRAAINTTINSFNDVPADVWYNESVSTMARGGYITGYEDGSFGGSRNITRAEFVTMLVRFVGVEKAECSFSDVSKDNWAYDYIATATAAGWISGYEDNTFRPDQFITRAEAMTIINRVLNRGVCKLSKLLNFKSFPDNLPTDWFYYEVIEATNSHEYTGTRPYEDWTDLYD